MKNFFSKLEGWHLWILALLCGILAWDLTLIGMSLTGAGYSWLWVTERKRVEALRREQEALRELGERLYCQLYYPVENSTIGRDWERHTWRI